MEIDNLLVEILKIHFKHHDIALNLLSRVQRPPLTSPVKKGSNQGIITKMAADFSIRTVDAEKQWNNAFKNLKNT